MKISLAVCLLTLAVGMAPVARAQAQNDSTPGEIRQPESKGVNPPAVPPRVSEMRRATMGVGTSSFDLDFPGGTPAELARAIEVASGEKPNLVVPENARSLFLPRLEVRSVTADQVFRTLEQMLMGGDGRPIRFVANGGSGPGAGSTVWVLTVLQPQRPVENVKVFYVGNYLDTYKIGDITTAIESAWEMQRGQPGNPSGGGRRGQGRFGGGFGGRGGGGGGGIGGLGGGEGVGPGLGGLIGTFANLPLEFTPSP